jgi:hypothetical protein
VGNLCQQADSEVTLVHLPPPTSLFKFYLKNGICFFKTEKQRTQKLILLVQLSSFLNQSLLISIDQIGACGPREEINVKYLNLPHYTEQYD